MATHVALSSISGSGNVNVNIGHGIGSISGHEFKREPEELSSSSTSTKMSTNIRTPIITTNTTASWQMDLLMEKLRQKSGSFKPLPETAKNIRVALLERRCILDQGDKVHLQKCLDLLQQNIKVNSLQSMVERLEMISRQQGLKFHPGATGNEWFISSDMFYLELLIDPNGVVQEVKIQHDGKAEQQSCPEIIDSLKHSDFQDFTTHLEGLVSIYQLNADKKIKSKAFIALQALETDLCSMASTYLHITDGEIIVMKTILGLLQPRKGGHPIKLVFYITPYEFLDMSSKSLLAIDTQVILEKKLGISATISIQPFTSHKLQMSTIVSIGRMPDGKSVPRYGVLNATNSTALPACFSINLKEGIPICTELLQAINVQTGIQAVDFDSKPILSLITQHISKGALDCNNSRGLFVTLPDQIHCYFMTQTPNLEGIVISNISFTLASQLPQVINILRQQLTFNTLVSSCVRIGSKPDLDCIVFEVNALSHQNLAVSFQHPLEDSLVTLEFDLKDVSHPQCHLHAVTNVADIIPTLEEHACKVVQKSMSIPITVRAVIKRWQSLKLKYEPPNPDYSVPVGGSFIGDSLPNMCCGAESERAQQLQQQKQQSTQVPGMVMNLVNPANSNANKKPQSPRGGNQPAYTISPIGPGPGMNFPMPQNPSVDLLNYMNPLFFQNLNTLQNLQNFQNFPSNISPAKMAMQMNLLASQMQQQGNTGVQKSLLMGLMDQVGQRVRRRKRKGMSSDSVTPCGQNVPTSSPSSMPRLSPAPSPKSLSGSGQIRLVSSKSPKRRPSEGTDISESNESTPTSQTPMGLLMTELGLDNPDPRWNIDITPVASSTSMDTFASKLSNFSTNDFPVDTFLKNLGDGDIEIDTTDMSSSSCYPSFSLPKKTGIQQRRPRDFSKRSMSLDSSQLGLDPENNLLHQDSVDIKPLVTPSLSITPVSTNSSLGSSAVNSLLANIRPGIEIIPLPNPVQIPNSITVTPILPKVTVSSPSIMTIDKKPLLTKDGLVVDSSGKKKSSEKKERKRKVGTMEEDFVAAVAGGKHFKLMSGFGNVGGGTTSIALKQPPAARPNFGLQLKKQGSPILNRPPTMKTTGSPTPKIGQGKPSVSTLKSVSGSPKFPEGQVGQLSIISKNKITKDKVKVVPGAGNVAKVTKNLTTTFNPGLIPPSLKVSMNDSSTLSTQVAAGMNMLLSGMQAGMKEQQLTVAQQNSANAAAILAKGVLDMTKAQLITSSPTCLVGQQQATQSKQIGFAPIINKKGGLAAVIDKLKSQYTGEVEIGGGGNNNAKKDMSKQDYIKASSTITSELQKAKNGNGGSGTTTPGAGAGEYIVKPGGQGLKLTINKAKTSSGKDKIKTGVKILTGMKRPFLPGTGAIKPLSPFPPKTGVTTMKKKVEKDLSPMMSKSPQMVRGPSPLTPVTGKPAKADEDDLTKKLFMPGAVRSLESGVFDRPKFDSNFQIPKKSKVTPIVLEKVDFGNGNGKEKGDAEKFKAAVEKSVETPPPETSTSTPNSGSDSEKTQTPKPFEPEDNIPADVDGISFNINFPMNLTQSFNLPTSLTSTPTTIAPKIIQPQLEDTTIVEIRTVETSQPMEVIETTQPTATEPEQEYFISTSAQKAIIPQPASPARTETFISPESPDPVAMEEDKPTPTIPTTPQRPPTVIEEVVQPPTPASPEDDDHLIMDIPSDHSSCSTKIAECIESARTTSNLEEAAITNANAPKESSRSNGNGNGSHNSNDADNGITIMPPPPPPHTFEGSTAMASVGSPSGAPVIPIVSLHIVHSPQPNSPLLRSPLVVASPLAVSPYTVDDELMDEAVIH